MEYEKWDLGNLIWALKYLVDDDRTEPASEYRYELNIIIGILEDLQMHG